MASSVLPPRSEALAIECSQSAVYADEVKALFRRNERPAFEAAYDRAYPPAFAAGGMSWVARSPEGAVVGHLAMFPRVFGGASRETRAALLVDLLFEARYRNFWSALALCRRAVSDIARAGFGFAYSDPTPPAEPLLRAVGFRQVGALERFVMPLVSLYAGFFRIVTRVQPLLVEHGDASAPPAAAHTLLDTQPADTFCARRSPQSYATRLGVEGTGWLVLRQPSHPAGDACAFAVVAPDPRRRTLHLNDVRWDDRRVTVEAVAAGIARAARTAGYDRLSVVTLASSAFASTLRRCGFISRGDALPLLVRELGAALPPADHWLLTYCDGSAW